MTGPLGARRGPDLGGATHPSVASVPAAGVWICDGDRPAAPDGAAILHIGPDRWLVAVDDGSAPVPAPRATDVGHGTTRFRVHGEHAVATLASGVALDLHVDAFAVGAAHATSFRGVFVVLHRVGTDDFHVYTGRSTARSCWEWLVDAAEGASTG